MLEKNAVKLSARQETPAYDAEAALLCKNTAAGRRPTCHIETYGCQMNVRDSEILYGLLAACGYEKAAAKEEADLILFNTCCVREHAEKRVFGNIGAMRALKEAKPQLIIGVCGCMMQQEAIAKRMFKRFPYVNLIFGTHVQRRLPEMLLAVLSGERVLAISADENDVVEGLPSIREKSASAFVNINFGCNNYCTYCIVPFVRGPERSRRISDIVSECEQLVQRGFTELTLLGQNVNSYGHDLGDCDFSDLLTAVAAIDGLCRLRFMTSHPKDLTDKLIHTMAATEKVCHHVHLPMQSGNDRILKRMNRRYTRAHYFDIVHKLRAAMPDVELTTDIIVGFPGETEEEFADTLSAVSEIGFATAFTFKYSPRAGTAAATMPDQVDEAVKRERLQRLNDLQAVRTLENNEKYIGHVGTVLAEGYDEKTQCLYGKYQNFKMAYFPGDASLAGQYIKVKSERVRGNSLSGTIIKEDML